MISLEFKSFEILDYLSGSNVVTKALTAGRQEDQSEKEDEIWKSKSKGCHC